MSSNVPIGKLITAPQGRDAVHIAIAPAVARERLSPGQHVGADGSSNHPHVGIVDPFLTQFVNPGDRYFICLYPNTVTSLRHEWTHPGFTIDDAEALLRRAAREQGVSYERLMEIMESGSRGRDEQVDSVLPSHVWDLWEQVTGEKADPDRREEYMGCAC